MKNNNVFLKVFTVLCIGTIFSACYNDIDDLTSLSREELLKKHKLNYILNGKLKDGTIRSIKSTSYERVVLSDSYENKPYEFRIILGDIDKKNEMPILHSKIKDLNSDNYSYGAAYYKEYEIASTIYLIDSSNTNYIVIDNVSKRFVKGSFDLKYFKKEIDSPGLDTVHIKSDFFKAHRYRPKK